MIIIATPITRVPNVMQHTFTKLLENPSLQVYCKNSQFYDNSDGLIISLEKIQQKQKTKFKPAKQRERMHSTLLSQSTHKFASSQLNDLINQFASQNQGFKRCYSAMNQNRSSKRLSATQRYPKTQIPQIPQQFQNNPIIASGPQFSFGKQKRALSFRDVKTPGPGAYLQQAKNSIYRQPPSYAMRAKIKDILIQKEIDSVPGVGNYSFKSSLIKVGSVFGKAQRESNLPAKKNTTISSATYNYQDVFKRLKSANPAYSIPQTKKLLISERISQDKMRKTPGPGTYKLSLDKGQCYSFGNKLPGVFDMYCKPRSSIPGPGVYQIARKAHEGKKSESYVFGTQEKFKTIVPSPGPGDYNIGRNYPEKIKAQQQQFQ